MYAGSVDRIPSLQHFTPSTGVLDRAEIGTHNLMLRVQLSIFNCELSHIGQATLSAVKLFRQTIMLSNDVTLLMQRGRIRQQTPFRKCADLLKNPRVANCAAGDRNPVHSRELHHIQACLSSKKVATSEDHSI